METVGRYFRESKQSFFLFGPRGTGKSTWLKSHYRNAEAIDLLAPAVFRVYSARPERLRELVFGAKSKTVIIDEIQKLPELLDVVHELIEQDSELQLILTGSSARKLKRTGVDLLAGRAIVRTMHPFMAAELGQSFVLKKSGDSLLISSAAQCLVNAKLLHFISNYKTWYLPIH